MRMISSKNSLLQKYATHGCKRSDKGIVLVSRVFLTEKNGISSSTIRRMCEGTSGKVIDLNRKNRLVELQTSYIQTLAKVEFRSTKKSITLKQFGCTDFKLIKCANFVFTTRFRIISYAAFAYYTRVNKFK